MNGVDLFLLGRTLMKIGEQAIPTTEPGSHATSQRSVLIVASDIRAHPGSSVGHIAERTGFPQSKVSDCVARLRQAGAVETTTDPLDRRRQLLRPAGGISERVAQVRAGTIAETLGVALGDPDHASIAEITAALESLAGQLPPEVLTRLRADEPRT